MTRVVTSPESIPRNQEISANATKQNAAAIICRFLPGETSDSVAMLVNTEKLVFR